MRILVADDEPEMTMVLEAVAQADQHTVDGKYQIRSLYFDTPTDKALLEKINGVSRRV